MLIYLSAFDSEEDKRKFEQLYVQYRDTMFYIAKSLLKDDYSAEDAVHKAFLKIINKFSDVGDIKSTRTKSFCLIICKNIAINMYHASKKTVQIDETEEDIPDTKKVDETVISKMEVERIVRIISKLPDIYRDPLYLHFGSEYSIKQISIALDIPYELAKKRIQRAKQLLTSKMQEEANEVGK